jgi:hypothetical protein
VKNYKELFDVFISGGSQHVSMLKPLLEKLQPYGKLHLASSFLTESDLAELQGRYDVLHTPQHSSDGYHNFELFSIRDINRLASAPYFIKLDADIHIEADWIDYVEECIAAHPDAVLFGPKKGNVNISFQISGEVVQQVLEREILVSDGCKISGGFYVGKTRFFKNNLRVMDIIHELMWCYKNGVRYRPTLNPDYWPGDEQAFHQPITLIGPTSRFQGNEDTLRSLVVHAVGAGDRLHVFDSQGRVRIDRPNTVGG